MYLCNMKQPILPTLLFALTATACSLQPNFDTLTDVPSPLPDRMLPAVSDNDQIVQHSHYTLSYSEADEQARWVAYMLTRYRTKGDVPRTDFFEEDNDVSTGSANYEDYRGSGYTRGHLMPAADSRWDETAMEESFLMSNITPQTKDFNEGIWSRLEGKMRHWANVYDTIFIVTGPILSDKPSKTIGHENHVSVPKAFYKAIYCPRKQQAIGFIVPHKDSYEPVQQFAVSIDELEKQTGIDFFPELDDGLENQIENDCCTKCWKW